MATMSKEEYLKRYLSGSDYKSKGKKKRSKQTQPGKRGLKIVDDDADYKSTLPSTLDNALEDDIVTAEDAPVVADVIDERPTYVQQLEQYKDDFRWKALGKNTQTVSDNSQKTQERSVHVQKKHSFDNVCNPSSEYKETRVNDKNLDQSPQRNSRPDQSPIRKLRHDSDSDESSQRENKSSCYVNQSSHQTFKHGSDSDQSPGRNSGLDSDTDKPVRRRPRQDLDSDQSPKRKRGPDSDTDKPVRRRPRQDSDSDQSPKRRKGLDSDTDKHVRRRPRQDSDSDQSPEQERGPESDTGKPVRRRPRQDSDSDQSPKRKRGPDTDKPVRRRPRQDLDSDQSSKRKNSFVSHRRTRWNSESSNSDAELINKVSTESDSKGKADKTLRGAKAGLSSAREMKAESASLRSKEEHAFSKISEDVLGRHASTVFRHKTGQRRDFDAENKKQEDTEAVKKEIADRYAQWGKGLKQLEQYQSSLEDTLHEMSKPLARHKDDQDLDAMLKEQEREGDPMLAFLKKKKSKIACAKGKPVYKGPAPAPNRFGIAPGYRWDGVDRSNGFEKKLFSMAADRKATAELAHKWSIENM